MQSTAYPLNPEDAQTGSTKIVGPGIYISRNFTIHAAKDGIVGFKRVKKRSFTGRTQRRTQVVVE